MPSSLPLIYWDSCVLLAYINGETDRLAHVDGLLRESGSSLRLVTSVFTIAEVAKAKEEQDRKLLDEDVERRINKLWEIGSPIQLAEFYELIAHDARALMQKALQRGWSGLKAGDAIHLATADRLKVVEFHTYDEPLDKYEELTQTHFKITRPIAAQPTLIP